MTAMGLVVSYDTILRGMLTPTELRMLQKQKDMESARQESVEKENGLSRNASLEKENVKKEENKIQTWSSTAYYTVVFECKGWRMGIHLLEEEYS